MANAYFDKQIWKNAHFPDPIEDNEDILIVLRQDLIIILFQILPFLLAFLFVSLFRLVIYRFVETVAYVPYLIDLAYFTFNVVLLTGFFLRFHNYFLSVQIITNRRIIDVTQNGLFRRELNELGFENIEDSTVKQNGFIPTIFNFGDVIVQTAASASNNTSGFIFKNVPSPSSIHKTIMEIAHQKNDDQPTQINNFIPVPSYPQPYPAPQQPQTILNSNPTPPPMMQFNPQMKYPNPLPVAYRQSVIEKSEEENS
ncbi:MAG: hypothetical protein OHK0017_08510 [Patescibacteria group bacterium]